MKAIGFTEFGGPEVLTVLELDEVHAGPGEVRIHVHAADVNPSDCMARAGAVRDYAEQMGETPAPPYVVGWDAAGVVDEIGPGVSADYRIGDDVIAITLPVGAGGAYVESLVVPAESVVRAPAGADHIAASTLPMNGLTARLALDHLALSPGATLAVTGAVGALGGFVVQLAKADGLTVIADASPADEKTVAALGADTVVARGPDVADRIRAIVPDGVDGLVDCAVLDDAVRGAVRDGGHIATVRFYQGASERGITWHPVFVADYLRDQKRLDTLSRQAEAGVLTLRVADTYPAQDAAEAHHRMQKGGVRGRLVLVF
jgi:NADPH:quinone reductase-like Zn-dependent oxidoreductase